MTSREQIKINKTFWKNLWNILAPFHRQMVWLAVVIALFELVRLIPPYLLKLIIEQLENFDQNQIYHLLGLIGLMLGSEMFTSAIHYFKDRRVFALLINVEHYLPMELQKKLVSLSLGYHERENTGNTITKIQRGVDKLIDLAGNFSWEFWPTITNVFFTFIVLLSFNWKISLSFGFFVPVFVALTIKMNRLINPMRAARHKEYEDASGILGQSIINIYTVQSFVQERRETSKYKTIRDHIKNIEKKEWDLFLKLNLLRVFIIDLGRIAVILASAYFAWHNAISIGSLVFFISLSETAYHSLFRISRTYDRLIECSTAVKRITNLLGENTPIKNQPKIKNTFPSKSIIEFKNVSFAYNKNNKNQAIKNVSFVINPGETIALVGPSGGGKSTIVKLLYRHYDVTAGAIIVNGHDIRDYDLYAYRSGLAIVPQDVEIFNTTIKENIAYGLANSDMEKITKAAQAANLDFIKKMPAGYNTLVGERGVRLSGGQKQRVGIARAILTEPNILIFDEATSNLDTHSERLIQKSIDSIAKNQTMIIIAHRLSTVINADRIFVLNEGRLVEQGTHEELLQNKDGMYTHLLRLQAVGELK